MGDTKGILLAGGRGTRLYPMTAIASKQLQPVYNKPMIYYPLTTLVMSDIREILVISGPDQLPFYRQVLKDGSQWGLSIAYAEQAEPKGIAQALTIGASFIGESPVMLMLGDNLIYGALDFMRRAVRNNPPTEATVFAYQVGNPSDYGVVEFDSKFRAMSLEEKPAHPKSHWAVPGMYIYPAGVSERARALQPSARGELEITDLNRVYLNEGKLRVARMGRGVAWFDTGTPESLLEAASFVHAIETRQGLFVGCPEEASLRMGFCSLETLQQQIADLPNCPYRDYVAGLVEDLRAHPEEFPHA
ncbi:MAG: glucose-1-phosphate thymidylyltransferase RfbA [Myxococcales bacterium]|nr:glucose-1-phosphate thymidylyltransferase RfbA [Myxococcales bacterium]